MGATERPQSTTSSLTTSAVKYISSQEAAAIDEELMSPEGCGFLLPQLMELAGLACASAVFKAYPPDVCPNLLVAAGPGNQGGDGLVAARHAKLWGYNVQVWYPKQGKTEIFQSLRKQLDVMEVTFVEEDDFEEALQQADVVLDSIFGFSFQGPPRAPFATALEAMSSESLFEFVGRVTRPPIVSVDIPSGWSVDEGNPQQSSSNPLSSLSISAAAADSTPKSSKVSPADDPSPSSESGQSTSSASTAKPTSSTSPSEGGFKTFTPEVVISLTAPKRGMKGYSGTHFLGGRFVPPSIAQKYALEGLDGYSMDEQIVDISGWADVDEVEE